MNLQETQANPQLQEADGWLGGWGDRGAGGRIGSSRAAFGVMNVGCDVSVGVSMCPNVSNGTL
jgi:hypothetical protein